MEKDRVVKEETRDKQMSYLYKVINEQKIMMGNMLELMRSGQECPSCKKRDSTKLGLGHDTPSPPPKKRKTDKEADALFNMVTPNATKPKPAATLPPSSSSYRTAYKSQQLDKSSVADLFSFFFVHEVKDMYTNDISDLLLTKKDKDMNAQCIKRHKSVVKSIILLADECPTDKPFPTVDPESQSETQEYKRWKNQLEAISRKGERAARIMLAVEDEDTRPLSRGEVMTCGQKLYNRQMPKRTPKSLQDWLQGVLSTPPKDNTPLAPRKKKKAKVTKI